MNFYNFVFLARPPVHSFVRLFVHSLNLLSFRTYANYLVPSKPENVTKLYCQCSTDTSINPHPPPPPPRFAIRLTDKPTLECV